MIPLEPGLLADLEEKSSVSVSPILRHALESPSKDMPLHKYAGIEYDFHRELAEVQSRLDHLTV